MSKVLDAEIQRAESMGINLESESLTNSTLWFRDELESGEFERIPDRVRHRFYRTGILRRTKQGYFYVSAKAEAIFRESVP